MIEIKNLKKVYQNKTGKFVAIQDLNLKLGDSGLVFLQGESGAGKSTILNILAGFEKYDEGQVLYNGKDILTMKQKERDFYRSEEMGIVFEEENLVSYMTVSQNICLAKELKGEKLSSKELNAVLNKLNILEVKNRKIQELSSGQLQRVLIARILISDAKILFLDEPTRRLDEKNSKEFWELIKKLSKKKLVFAVSHDKEVVNKYADRIIQIKDGNITKDTYKDKNLKIQDEKLFAKENEKSKFGKTKNIKPSTALKLGFKSLANQKGRYITTIIFSFLVLVSFAFMFLLGTYNPSVSLAKSVEDDGLGYALFSKVDGTEIQNEDIAKIEQDLGITLYKYFKTDLHCYFGNSLIINKGFCNLGGFAEWDDSYIENGKWVNGNNLNHRCVYGNYPYYSNVNDIAISDYLLALMNKYGVFVKELYNSTETVLYKDRESLRDFCGKRILIENSWCRISGYYETDYQKYVDESTLFGSGEEFERKFKEDYSIVYIAKRGLYVGLNEISENIGTADLIVENLSQANYKVSVLEGTRNLIGSRISIASGEIVLPYQLFNLLYGTNFTESEAMAASDEELSSAMQDDTSVKIKTKYGFEREYTIVGLSTENIMLASSLYMDENGATALLAHANFPAFSVTHRIDDTASMADIIEKLEQNGYKVQGQNVESVRELAEKVYSLKNIFVVITIILLVFTLYFISIFYADAIRKDKHTIGVYRTMGVTSKELVGMYLSTAITTAIVSLIFAIFAVLCAVGIGNAAISNLLHINFYAFNIDSFVYLWMGCIAIGTSLIGSLVPILYYCNKTPKNVVKI